MPNERHQPEADGHLLRVLVPRSPKLPFDKRCSNTVRYLGQHQSQTVVNDVTAVQDAKGRGKATYTEGSIW